jgi:hypothetical protein
VGKSLGGGYSRKPACGEYCVHDSREPIVDRWPEYVFSLILVSLVLVITVWAYISSCFFCLLRRKSWLLPFLPVSSSDWGGRLIDAPASIRVDFIVDLLMLDEKNLC